ncbi:hypothetical protein LIQ82_01600 [Intestinibacter bartlettii]|mgnify:FL=1|uniref:hypothetical protein n=1 Tax=Intestinibacter bartlettii TaxID=261299 RepID=UPI001D028242|nr:hypothetical protein [Intestinibacter bartlettii]MCB5744979.1 hypothetical protein [Intestinibacter bartlettii]MDU1253741.1 hypothetical protein [Peptostreptococcaceae bacterium]MDU2694431.1 hypothetical protein [Intestinibacter bartlettii]MDU6198114.1 hypothetical protein [Intestinibacter bartlettii]
MNNFFKKIINFIKGEIIIMVFISFTILDMGVYLLINYGFELIYSKFNIINFVLGTLGIILIIIFFIMLYKEICLTIKDDE